SVETDQREQQRQCAEAAREGGQKTLGIERAIDLVVQSTEPKDRQPGVGFAHYAADRRNRLLRCAVNLDVEGRARVFAFEYGEERLRGIVAEITVVETGADADDDDIGLDVRTGARSDVDTKRIAVGQITLYESLIDDGGAVAGLAGRAGIA